MKNINPLFLLAASFFVLLISFYSLNVQKNNLQEQKIEFNAFEKLAKNYNNLLSSWGNKNNTTDMLSKIIKSSGIKNANIKNKDKIVRVQISNINSKKIGVFINKLLNNKINISKLEVSSNRITLEVVN